LRFMMLVKADRSYEAGTPPSPELMAAVGKLGEEMFRTGVMIEMGGLAPTSKGARLRLSRGKVSSTDGPFVETKEIIGGYAILQAKSKAEAIELGKRFLQVHGDVMGPSYELELEVRQLYDPPDAGPPPGR
jgi:hypothetical protein